MLQCLVCVTPHVYYVTVFGVIQEEERYRENLKEAKKYAVLKGVINGICFGFTFFAAYATHALAYWYGTQLFIDGDYSAGQIYVVSLQCLHNHTRAIRYG